MLSTAPVSPPRASESVDRFAAATYEYSYEAGWQWLPYLFILPYADACAKSPYCAPRYKCDVGGLCLNHSSADSYDRNYTDNFTSTWGGEVVMDDNGTWHMYAASFGHDKALGSWLSDSRVIHSTAAAPQGMLSTL